MPDPRTGASLLLAAADNDGSALAQLRRTVRELTELRGTPIHIGVLVTDVLAGVGDERDLDDDWVTTLTNGAQLTAPLPPGVPVEVRTASMRLASVYGQLACSHLDPPSGVLEPDGSLPVDAGQERRRLVVDFSAAPEGLGLSDDSAVAFNRACRAGRWFTSDGHLHVTVVDDGRDDVARYARWLADARRRTLCAHLPDSADRIEVLLRGLVDAISQYEASHVTTGAWVWTSEALAEHYQQPVGSGALRHELDDVARGAVAVYRSATSSGYAPSRRALACELALRAESWEPADRSRLCGQSAWISTLFALTQTLARELPDTGPPLLETDHGHVHARADERFGIAGVWALDPVDDDEVERLRQQARDELDQAAKRRGEEDVVTQSYPFTHTLTARQFEQGRLTLPPDVHEELHPDANLTVRLAFTPRGRMGHRPVVVAALGRPDESGALPFEWPAMLAPGSRLDGVVSRRGRLIELRPASASSA